MSSLELKIPPPLLTFFLGLFMYLAPGERPLTPASPLFHNALMLICALLGSALGAVALWHFYKLKTTPDPRDPSKTSALATTGIYRYTRNPMYLGLFFLLLSFALYLGKVIAFLALPVFVLYLTRFQIIPEERALRRLFGRPYDEYCLRVRRWL